MVANSFCEVNCNRGDSILSLTSKNALKGNQTIRVKSRQLVSDQLEIGKVVDWVRSLRSNINNSSIEVIESVSQQ